MKKQTNPGSGSSPGLCPVCKKGQVIRGTDGWACNHFRSVDDKCGFIIYGSYRGYAVTDEDVAELIAHGYTGPREFTTLDGAPFVACLKRVGDKIKVTGMMPGQSISCPHCGSLVVETARAFVCTEFSYHGDAGCRFRLPKTLLGRKLEKQDVTALVEHGRTEVLDGFSRDNKTFSSCLVLSADGSVLLDGRICRCPKCGGTVYAGTKGYGCSNYRNPDVRCDFVVWRVIGKCTVTVEDVRQLCSRGRTRVMRFHAMDGGTYERALALDRDCKVRMAAPD